MRRLLLLVVPVLVFAGLRASPPSEEVAPRVVVLTDISNEPDDEQSLVRFLVYSNEFEVEGLIATTSTWLRKGTREDLIRRQIDAYEQVRPNLLKQAPGFPEPEHLRAVTFTGQPEYGMDAVGEGKSTAGSRRIIEVVDREDERPVWVTIWGGANTLAQALWDVRASRTEEEVAAFVSKLRVYSISDQDDAGPWMRKEFQGLFYVVSPSRPDAAQYDSATWSGIGGDRLYKNGPGHVFHMVDNPWLEENIIKGHGPLGALYPKVKYIMEGDTPSYLGLINNGLGWSTSPGYGGWGGRYSRYHLVGEAQPIWTNIGYSRDTVTADNGATETTNAATIWRWREHFQNDFAARMDWCVAEEYADANHNPRPVLNGDKSLKVIHLKAGAGDKITLSAEGTEDPDGDDFEITWWIYHDAGRVKGASLSHDSGPQTVVSLPAESKRTGAVHVILQVKDAGEPGLYGYRRAVIEVGGE